MRFLKNGLPYLFFGNIFIALCAVSLVGATGLLIQKPLPFFLYLFVLAATVFLYTFDSLSPRKLNAGIKLSARKSWVKNHRGILFYWVILTGVSTLFFFFKLPFSINLFFIGHLFFISVLYSVPVFPQATGWQPLRHIPFLKIFLIAYVWSCVTVWLPLLSLPQNIYTSTHYILFVQRFLFILALTILFDIRDVNHDQENSTLTVPGFIGINKARYLSWVLLLAFGVAVYYSEVTLYQKVALFLSGIMAGVVIKLASENRNEYFYAVVADGVMILQFLLLLAF